MEKNRFSKYLLYAIGEIILVVIGILIALSINTWNQNRQDRLQEKELLAQLQTEYASNLNQIQSKIEIRKTIINSCLKLLEYRKLKNRNIVADSFNLHLSRAIVRPTYDPELGVSDELIGSGKLYLLKNSDLRNRITSFSSTLSELREEEMVIFNQTENAFIPFIVEHYQLGRVIAEFMDDTEFKSQMTLFTDQKYVSIKELFDQVDFQKLLEHPDFEDHLAYMIFNTQYTNEQSGAVKKRIENILELVQTEKTKDE